MLTIENISKTGMYTKKEVCGLTGFTPRTLNNKMNEGKIKFFRRRDTGKPIFKGIDIIAFLSAKV
jgi:hypothetical protein